MTKDVTSHVDAERWARSYQEDPGLGWPSETLIRVFKGDYIPLLDKDYVGKSVLDVSFGNGNNLVFLGSLGCKLFGTEVHEELCTSVREKLRSLGYHADLRNGTNRALPFPDNTFDFLVSWNVIHYETTEEGILDTVREYARVLKPQGRFFLSTTGPEHKILDNAATLGAHRYRINREDDFRRGEIMYCFDAPHYLVYYFSQHFNDVLVGRTHDFLFSSVLDWFIATGVKK